MFEKWEVFLRLPFLWAKQHLPSLPGCCDPSGLCGKSCYKGRNLTKISTATAPRNVGGKAPSRKRHSDASEVVALDSTDVSATNSDERFQAEAVNPTTLVSRRSARPIDPPSSVPLVPKKIAGTSGTALAAPGN